MKILRLLKEVIEQSNITETNYPDAIYMSKKQFIAFLEKNNEVAYGGYEDKKLRCVMCIKFSTNKATIHLLETHKKFRKRHIATEMLKQIEEVLKYKGCSEINIFVIREKFEQLKSFYYKNGFRLEHKGSVVNKLVKNI